MRLGAILVAIAVVAALVASIPFTSRKTVGEPSCSGRQLLPTRRPEGSCRTLGAQIVEAPDQAQRAVIYPVDVSLDATPDMESRVVIRRRDGVTVNSKDYSSVRGQNGYTPDGRDRRESTALHH